MSDLSSDSKTTDQPNQWDSETTGDKAGLGRVVDRLIKVLVRDTLIHQTLCQLRLELGVDRVVLYYFYYPWKGQVTCESLSQEQLSILGSTGADDCFNGDYAQFYLQGRIKATNDIETEPIHDCHRAFLQSIQVKANLVVPVLTQKGLWGLLVAHHCQGPRSWQAADIAAMKAGAANLAAIPVIRDSL